MSGKKELQKTANEKLDNFLTKHRVVILSIAGAVVAVILIYTAAVTVLTNANKKALTKIDAITYALTKDSYNLSSDELQQRRTTAATALAAYNKKGGIIGIRANMLSADLSFEQKDYTAARSYWLAAAKADTKAYTAPLSYFNAAVCSEELDDSSSAITYYQKASEAPDFLLVSHALFSLGRVKEAQQDFTGASEAYQKIVDKSPSDKWADLAKSRLIALADEGKIK
ncbi:MAG: tetratricopeptide repeat protein [Treponema sp.]|jgi:tetratricopeptide (TPR) repeat protein|nr:tetratricopeptide repeat protein [Treponema sp.]